MRRVVVAALAFGPLVVSVAACGKNAEDATAPTPRDERDARAPVAMSQIRDAGAPDAPSVAAPGWPELADLPSAAPWRIVDLPVADPATPEVAAAGPLIVDQIAIVATSRTGFVAIDLTTAEVVWSRRAGPRVAPPIERGDRAILVGDCPPGPPPKLAAGDLALGCFDVVDPVHVADEKAGIIHGPKKLLADFDKATGASRTLLAADGAVLWRRGDRAIRVDLATGAATAASPADVSDHVDVAYGATRWTYTLEGDTLTGAREGAAQWTTPTSGAVLVGAFNDTPPRIPVVRIAGRGRPRNGPHAAARTGTHKDPPPPRATRLLLLDIAGTDGTLGQVSHSFPGMSAEASAFGAGGATIVAVRLDDSGLHDYVAAFDGNGLLSWAWQVPEPADGAARTQPLQLALTADNWVVALFDDRLAILPLVSEAPTPDAAPSRNPTP